jgi:hypothetical protein
MLATHQQTDLAEVVQSIAIGRRRREPAIQVFAEVSVASEITS